MSSCISRSTFYLKFQFVSDLGPHRASPLSGPGWEGVGECRCRGWQWGRWFSLWLEPRATLDKHPQWPARSHLYSESLQGNPERPFLKTQKTSASSDPQKACRRPVCGGSCFTVGFLRCLPALSSQPCRMFVHPVGKQAVPPGPARMPVHGLAIKQACHGSCLRSFREGGTSPARCPLLHHPRVGTLVSLRSESFDFSGVCSSFNHLCSVICL